MGRMDVRLGPTQPAFQALLRLLGTGQCWVKLSAPYRIALEGPPYAAVLPFARELLKCNPERLVWGTDWPHPDVAVVPENPDLLDVLLDWVPDAGMRNRILVDNPAKLYRF